MEGEQRKGTTVIAGHFVAALLTLYLAALEMGQEEAIAKYAQRVEANEIAALTNRTTAVTNGIAVTTNRIVVITNRITVGYLQCGRMIGVVEFRKRNLTDKTGDR